MTVIGKPGAVAVSIAGVQDRFKVLATLLMMCDGLTGTVANEEDIKDYLLDDGLDATPENIAKVKSFFPTDKVWESGVATPEPEMVAVK